MIECCYFYPLQAKSNTIQLLLSGAPEAGLTRDSFLFQDKINVLDYSTLIVLNWHVLTDMIPVIEGKIIQKMA